MLYYYKKNYYYLKMKTSEKKVKINIVTLGACGVGKTSIINRIKDGTFLDNYQATIGLDFFVIERRYDKRDITMSLHFNDTTGLELYQGIIPVQYIRNSHIVLFVFSNIETLNDIIKKWYVFYKENADVENSRFILVGNKSDIFGNEKEEIEREGKKFAEEIDAHFITCSAKSADNMDNLERYIISESKRFIDEAEEIIKEMNNNKKLNLEKKNINKKNDCNC